MLALALDPDPSSASPHARARLVTDHPAPERRAGEALVRVRVSGVCDTDLQLARGYMGFKGVPGHEFVGEVLAADDASWIGKRVVADINAGCGVCEDCTLAPSHRLGTHGRFSRMAATNSTFWSYRNVATGSPCDGSRAEPG